MSASIVLVSKELMIDLGYSSWLLMNERVFDSWIKEDKFVDGSYTYLINIKARIGNHLFVNISRWESKNRKNYKSISPFCYYQIFAHIHHRYYLVQN